MRRVVLALATVLLARPLAAQVSSFVTTLGRDTLDYERFERRGDTITGDWVTTYGGVLVHHYVIALGPDGTPRRVDTELRRRDGTVVATIALTMDGDSVTVVTSADSGRAPRRVAGAGVFTILGASVGMLEPILVHQRAARIDSAIVPVIVATGPFAVRRAPIVFFGGDSVRLGNPAAPTYVRVDAAGHVLAASARATTTRTETVRVAPFDLAAAIARAPDVPPGTPILGVVALSPRDTVRAMIGAAQLLIDYGRPSVRGRDVFVRGVLGDTVWRTGANAATQLSTTADLVVGGHVVPAGTYTLWTRVAPDNSSYALVLNSQVGQWGTEHHADRDVLRVPLAVGPLAAPVERFTIAVEPASGGGARLALRWGTVELSAPIAAR
jgi:hypothetical protein